MVIIVFECLLDDDRLIKKFIWRSMINAGCMSAVTL